GKIVTHVFEFENKGDAELIIKKVETSCGCTAVLLSKNRLKPGEKGKIKVTFNSRGFEGKVVKYIFVRSNDPKNSYKQLKISANVLVPPRPKIVLIPNYEDLGIILDSEEVTCKGKIKNEGDEELIVNQIISFNKKTEFHQSGKKINFPIRIKPGETKEIEIKLIPPHKKGVLREYIQFRSNDQRRQTITLYLTGYVIDKDQLKKLFTKYKDLIK
ncbi:DUF1573 domain-containing protein, partial [Candidatus Aminicenantes bacterium AC-335-G13]|nr:DUF1573 domain-containing protein [Candidatus Aminicenantes bacterium AC-335-G13]